MSVHICVELETGLAQETALAAIVIDSGRLYSSRIRLYSSCCECGRGVRVSTGCIIDTIQPCEPCGRRGYGVYEQL